MALSDRASEKDRLYLEAAYAYFIKGDRKKHEVLLKELIRKYPKEKFAYHYLGDFYYSDKGLCRSLRSVQKMAGARSPGYFCVQPPHDGDDSSAGFQESSGIRQDARGRRSSRCRAVSIGRRLMYRQMGQLDKAIAKYKKALEINPDVFRPPLTSATLCPEGRLR